MKSFINISCRFIEALFHSYELWACSRSGSNCKTYAAVEDVKPTFLFSLETLKCAGNLLLKSRLKIQQVWKFPTKRNTRNSNRKHFFIIKLRNYSRNTWEGRSRTSIVNGLKENKTIFHAWPLGNLFIRASFFFRKFITQIATSRPSSPWPERLWKG